MNFPTKALITVLKSVTTGQSNLPQEIAEQLLCNDNLDQR